MADTNPYDLSGLYGDTPATAASPQKSKLDPYDVSGLYAKAAAKSATGTVEAIDPTTGKPFAVKVSQNTDESLGSKILNAPGVGSTLNFLNDYAVQPFETLAQAGGKAGKFLATAPMRANEAIVDAVNPGEMERERQAHPATAKIADTGQGIAGAVGEVGGSLIADPRNWPFLGASSIKSILLKRATQAGFTAMMSKGAIDQANQIGEVWDSATPEQRAEQLTKLGINVVGAVGSAGELGKPIEAAAQLPVAPKPRLNFLQPMIDDAPREGTPPLLNAEAAESAVQPKLDAARAERQAAARSEQQATLQGPALPIDEKPSPVTPTKAEPSLYDLDALYNEPKAEPSPRVGEEVPGLDQQAEALQPKKPIITPPPPPIKGLLTSNPQFESSRTQNESSPENALQGDMSVRGGDVAKTPESVPGEQGATVAQESTPLQAGVHPNYEQIGIDADSGQPILKQKTERRLDTSERKRVSEMSPEEMQKELLTSESLNLPNKRAFLEEEARNPSPAISMSDADGLKAFNDKFGYEYGNKLLEAKAEALREAGLDAYHDKGDEFLQRDGSPADLQNKLEHARELLRNKEIEVELNDGTIKRYKGVDFSYGVGKDLSEAEANLKQHKADREAAGERARGELRGITEAGSQGGEVNQGNVQRVSTAKKTASLESGTTTQGVYGSETNVKTPSGSVPAKYKVVEADSLVPSHNAQSFAKNPQYPEGVQERAYHTSKEAQTRVIQQAQNYDPAYTVNTNPDAVNGPPVITPDGIVLGGNSRAMSTQRLYNRGGAEPYINEIKKQAAAFGVDPNAVDGFKRPVLVREVPKPATVEEARRLGSDLNRSMTGALGVSEKAVSAGKSITQSTLRSISGLLDEIGHSATMRDLFRERPREIVQLLVKDGVITERERPQFVDTSTGGLSEDGKNFVERALIGSVVDDPVLLDRTPKSIINKLDSSLADIATLAGRTDEYNIMPLIREALSEHADIAQRGTDVALHLQQSGMFGPERNEAVDAVIRKLADSGKSVRDSMRSFTRDANADVQNQGFLGFGEPPAAYKAFNESFGTKFTERQFAENLVKTLESIAEKGTIEPGVDRGSNPSKTETPADRVQPSSGSEAPRSAEEGTGLNAPEASSKAAVDRAKAQAAKQRLNDKLGRSHSGVPVDAIPDLLEYGYYTFKAGARTFAEWSAKMLKDFGEQVRPHLKKAWDDIQEKLANGEEPSAKAKAPASKLNFLNQTEEIKKPQPKAQAAPPQTPNFLKPKTASSAPEPERAGNINLAKFNVTDAAKQLIKAADVTGEGFEEQRRGVQSHEKTQSLAAKLGLTSDELARTRKGSAFNAEELHAAGNLLASSAENMRKLQDKAAKTGSVDDQIAVLEAYAKHVSVQQAVSGATAEAGRALNALKIIRQARDVAGKDNRTKVLDALRENLGEDWVNRAEAITKKVSQFPEGDTVGLNKFLRESVKVPLGQMLNNYFLANLLSGPKTPIKKGLGDLALAALQHPQRVLEGAIDLGRAKLTGKPQEHFIREALPAATAYFGAFPKALQKFAYIMRNGFTPEQAAVLEAPGINELPGGLKNPLNLSTRWLSATAEMYKAMALEGELHAQAVRQALKEGASGQALDKRIQQLVTERPPEMIDKAIKQAKLETYTTDADGMVRLAKSVQQIYTVPEDFAIKPLRGFQPGRVIIPFSKVPWNIAKMGIEYGTPARALSFLSKEGRSPENFAPNAAKAIVGSSIFAIGYGLAQQGNLTGPMPKDPKEKERFLGEGRQPYSFKVGNKWISYHVLPPLAIGWAAAAAMHDNNQDPALERIADTGAAVAKSIVDASFFAGLNNAMEAINGYQAGGGSAAHNIGQGAKSLVGNVASGFVPLSSLLRQVTHAKDSTVRDADTIYERVKANLPILSEELPAKRDRFGRPVQRLGDTGAAAFLPIQPAESGPLSRVDEEVDRLGIKVQEPSSRLSVGNQKYDLTKDQERDLRTMTGQQINSALSELYASGRYQELTDDKKQLITQRVMDAVRERARVKYIKKIAGENIPLTKHVRPNFLPQEAR